MAHSGNDPLWQVAGNSKNNRLLFHAWDDAVDVVCYDTASGDTHLLSPLAATVLHYLQRDAKLGLDAVISHVAASLSIPADNPADANLVSAIEQTLSEFTARGVLAQT